LENLELETVKIEELMKEKSEIKTSQNRTPIIKILLNNTYRTFKQISIMTTQDCIHSVKNIAIYQV